MRRRHALILALSLLAPAAVAQDVAYEKYQLDNGMTVILHEDHSLPQVNVNIWYRVGSKDEPRGRSGFAHLFEHLMFMGTERVPGSDFDNIMEAGGGFNNATTSSDRTNYFDNGPAELLPTLLWLEADRLEALGATMTQEKLDRQREVVRNERRQNYENRPYGESYLKTSELLYPEDHPYHIPVIGTHADLEAATVDDVKGFFAEYYVPNNASLVVAGDFDPAEIKPLIERLFGTIPRGADVVHRTAEPVRLDGETVYTMTDAVQYAATSINWHSPPFLREGDAEMDLIAAILSDGISSRLYQRLVVEDKLAVEVSAAQASSMLGSTFSIDALANDGVELERVEAAIDEVLAAFLEQGVTEEELERRKVQFESSTLRGLQSIQNKSDRLNLYEFYFGEPNSFARDLDRYRNATPEGVLAWARRVLHPDQRVIVRVLPEVTGPAANPRDTRPSTLASGGFAPEAPNVFELSNGVVVQHWQKSELPLVELSVVLPVGSANDSAGKGGLASLAADMLDEGAGVREAVPFADELERLGASLSAQVTQESTHVRLSGLRRNLDASLTLAADAVLRPRFDPGEWARVHDQHLKALRQAQDSPTSVARVVAMRAFFGDDHPYGRPVEGTLASAGAVTLNDVVDFYSATYRPDGAKLLIAGDLTADEAKTALEAAFGQWKGLLSAPDKFARPEIGEPANDRFRAVIVDRPGAVQTVIRFMMPAPAYSAPTRPARELVTVVLGGTFTSRLNQNLREEKGYTYGASARIVLAPSTGYLFAQSSVLAEVTGASLAEFMGEFESLRTGNITAEEAEKARASRRLRAIQSFAGLDGILATATELVLNDRTFEDFGRELESLGTITQESLNSLAKSTVPLERAVLVLVGDRASILAQIEDLDLPTPVEVDADGAPVAGD